MAESEQNIQVAHIKSSKHQQKALKEGESLYQNEEQSAPKRQRSNAKKSSSIKRVSSPTTGKSKSPKKSSAKTDRNSLTTTKNRKSLPSSSDSLSPKKKKTTSSLKHEEKLPTTRRQTTQIKNMTRSRKSATQAKISIKDLLAKKVQANKKRAAKLVKAKPSIAKKGTKNSLRRNTSLAGKSEKALKDSKTKEKSKKKEPSKRKRKRVDSSDDDILYSLVDEKINKKCCISLPNLFMSLSNRECTPCSTVSTDSEVSFNPANLALIPMLPDSRLSPYPDVPTTLRSPLTNMNGWTPEIPADSSAPLLTLAGVGAGQPPNSPPPSQYESLLKTLVPKTGAKKKQSVDLLQTDDSQRRLSVRQSECSFKYKEIIVKKAKGYTQVSLDSQSKCKNALNPKVFKELEQVLRSAKYDDSTLVLLTGAGNVFCSGIDLWYLLGDEVSSVVDKRQCVNEMVKGIRDFVSALIQFPKPLVAAVNGPAVGLGVGLLPLCDIVYASDKATFSCPYTRLGQTPEGGASLTLPQSMGLAMSSEILLAGRKITAMEANQCGLVSQVFWPTAFMQEVIPRLQHMTNTHSTTALEATKLLVRSQHRSRIEHVVSTESQMLTNLWLSPQCQTTIREYLASGEDL